MPRMGPTAESLHRHWTMLGLIPRAPRKIDAATIETHLAQLGIEVTRRSIQRDLDSLSRHFIDLHRDDRSKPYGWCWRGNNLLFEVPGMGVPSAVTFELLQRHAIDALPRTHRTALAPYFRRARDVLAQNPDAKMSKWPRKVRVVPQGLVVQTPQVPHSILDSVYTALLEERRLLVRYQKRGADALSEYEVSPHGLVLKGGILILVASFWDYQDANQLLLHRMKHAEVSSKTIFRPQGFDLDEFIASGNIGFRHSERPCKLVMWLDQRAAVALLEAPLSRDQTLAAVEPTGYRLTATVPDTAALRSWIRGHGALAEVLSPKQLRTEMARDAEALAERYRAHEGPVTK